MCSMVRTWLFASLTAFRADASGRGIGDGKYQTVKDMELLKALPWWYNWGKNPHFAEDFDQEFVAMTWSKQNADELASWQPHHSTKYLLGYNEPNMRGQSNMSAAEACANWPTVVKAAKDRGLQVGSPAANKCTPSDVGPCRQAPTDWFDDFFSQPGCDLSTIDFIATHKYGCNATDTVEYVKELNKRYNKPIWLTEFACSDSGPQKQLEFMQEVLPLFDAMPEILPRYAWFEAKVAAGTHSGRVLLENDALTDLGKYYTSTIPAEHIVV